MSFRAIALVVTCVMLHGCMRYEPLALTQDAHLAPRVLDLDGASGPRITLERLDRIVLANNLDLRAARAKRGVSQAQILIAGILPNPQVTAAYPFLISGPGTVDSYSAAFSQDLRSILLRPAKMAVAQADAANVDASLLWHEWQTIGKARLLYVDIVSGARALRFIAESRRLLKERYGLTSKAIAQGNATLATLSPDLVAVGDVARTQADLVRLQLARRHQLAVLIGLSPDAPLLLADNVPVPRIRPAEIRRQLATLASRRPDLIALQFGYRSQDAKVRQMILAQFPNLSMGLFAGQDTSNILSMGPQLTMDLPIFDRNQGNLALETATRLQLNQEFSARVATATGEVESLLTEQALIQRQIAELEPRLRQARAIAEKTENAFRQGSFDERAYVDIESARLAREQEKVALEQADLEGQVGLATLVGAGFPNVTMPPEPAPADPFGMFQEVVR